MGINLILCVFIIISKINMSYVVFIGVLTCPD